MVTEGELVASARFERVVQSPAPHFGAERAGVFLLPDVENDLADIGLHARIGNSDTAAKLRDRRIVHFTVAKLDCDGFEIEALRVIAPELRERAEKNKAVLSPRDANRNAVAVLYHAVVVNALAHDACKAVYTIQNNTT